MPPKKIDLANRTDWVFDHAGNPVFIHWSLRYMHRSHAKYPDLPPPIRPHTARMVRWLTSKGVPHQAVTKIAGLDLILFQFVIPFLFMGLILSSCISTAATRPGVLVAVLPLVVAAIFLNAIFNRFQTKLKSLDDASRIAKATVERGYCPICTHPIDGLKLTVNDGVECPCCAAVWPAEWGDQINGYFRTIAKRSATATNPLFTVDDRGTKHRLKFPKIPPIRRSPDETEGTTLILDYLAKREGPIARPLSLALAFAGCALLAIAFLGGLSGFRFNLIATLVAMGIFALAAAVTNWQMKLRHHRNTFEDMFHQNHLCKACGYNCSGLQPDNTDGATQCPECAAAWKFPERGHDEELSAQPDT